MEKSVMYFQSLIELMYNFSVGFISSDNLKGFDTPALRNIF